jgi:hypothetical protein
MAAKRGRGRPTLLNDERTDHICQALENGVAIGHAVRASGIDPQTYYNWLERGTAERERLAAGLDPDPKEQKYVEFFERVKKAEAVGATKHMENISRTALDGTWQASAWILERRFPRDYGRFDRAEMSGPDGGPVPIQVSTEDLERKVRKILDQRKKP